MSTHTKPNAWAAAAESIGQRGVDLSRITIWKHSQEWRVWIPPTGPESFDTDGWSHVGPFGDSFWPTFDEAIAFVKRILEPGTSEPGPVNLAIEYVEVGNDNTDALGFQLGAWAAICYDEGEHQGLHFLVPVSNAPEDQAAGRDELLGMIEGSAFPYRVLDNNPRV